MKTCLCLLLSLCIAFSVHANGVALSSGNDATGGLISTDSKLRVLDEHPTVSIQSENLHVRLYSAYAMVDLTYKFRNGGRKTKAVMGFPSIGTTDTFFQEKFAPRLPKAGTKLQGPPQDLSDYTISLNGQALPWQLYSMTDPGEIDSFAPPSQWRQMYHSTQWLVSEMSFAANSEGVVRITYSCPYGRRVFNNDGGADDISDSIFAYKLSTGRNWHGPIHEGHVEVECVQVPAKYVTIAPGGRFKRVGNSFIWEFADLRPGRDDDIRIIADPTHQEPHSRGYIWYSDHWYYKAAPCSAEASSELHEGDRYFGAKNLVNAMGSCWIEGVEGDGIGESVTLSLKKPCRIDGFYLTNGFRQKGGSSQEQKTLYEINGRVAELEVKVDDQPSFRTTVPDMPVPYFVLLPHGETMAHKVKLTIAAVYRGTKYRDTCIGEVALRQVLTKRPPEQQAR